MKIELLPFEYTMFHFSRFRNTSALLYLHITTTVFRCVSTVCKHLGYARANIVFFITFLSLKTNWIIKKSQDRFINILIEQDVHYFASKWSLLTFIYDNKSLTSVYMNSNDGVHKLLQLLVYCIHACRKRGTNMAYWQCVYLFFR